MSFYAPEISCMLRKDEVKMVTWGRKILRRIYEDREWRLRKTRSYILLIEIRLIVD